MATPPVAVLGAGVAGLTAARTLRRAGVPVVLFEGSPHPAGLAAGVSENGWHLDTGAHFMTNRLAHELGAGAACRPVTRYGEAVWLRGRAARYPLGLLASPSYTASAVRSRLARHDRPLTAEDWFRAQYGRRLADEVALPLVEAWSGLPAGQLAASVGEKIPGSVAGTLWLTAARRVTRRPVAIGYCGSRPQSTRVWHVYPRSGGVAAILQPTVAELGDVIRLSSPVEKILVSDGAVTGVRVAGEDVEVSAVVSSAPAPVLPRLVEGTAALDPLGALTFRAMVFVSLRFTGRGLLPDVVTWTPEADAPYFRLTETPMAMPWLAPEGRTQITADIGAVVGDAVWTAGAEELGELCLQHLERIVPDARARLLDVKVQRSPVAYPVFALATEDVRVRLERGSGVTGLHSVGRNGAFGHLLMEDVYWRTRDLVERELVPA